mgnify:CR=1 FL=1
MGSDKYGPKTKYLMLVFVCLFIFLVSGFGATTFNLLQVTVATELGWTPAERAVVATAYSTGMIWFAFFSGILADKVNIKRMMGSLIVALSVFIVLRAFLVGVTLYYIIMFGSGVLVSLFIPVGSKIIPLWFGSKQLAVANGVLTSSNPLGQFAANFFALPLIGALGGRWQNLYILLGILIAVLGICVFIFGKNRRSLDAELRSDQISGEKDVGIWKNIKEVVKVPQMWLYIMASAVFVGAVLGGGSQLYVVLQVDPRWGLGAAAPGQITAMNNIGSMIMYIVWPLLIGKFMAKHYDRNYRLVAIICGVLSAIASFVAVRSFNFTTIRVLFIANGIMFGQIIPAPKVLMLRLPQISGARAGTALGILTTLERVSQTVFTAIFGAVLATNTVNPSDQLSWMYLLYAVAPALIIVAWILDNRQKKKAAAAVPAQ